MEAQIEKEKLVTPVPRSQYHPDIRALRNSGDEGDIEAYQVLFTAFRDGTLDYTSYNDRLKAADVLAEDYEVFSMDAIRTTETEFVNKVAIGYAGLFRRRLTEIFTYE